MINDVSTPQWYGLLRLESHLRTWKGFHGIDNQLLDLSFSLSLIALSRPNYTGIICIKGKRRLYTPAFTARANASDCAFASAVASAKAGVATRETITTNIQIFIADILLISLCFSCLIIHTK